MALLAGFASVLFLSCSVYTKELLAGAGEAAEVDGADLEATSASGGSPDMIPAAGGSVMSGGGGAMMTGGAENSPGAGGTSMGGAPVVLPDPDPCTLVSPGESLADFDEGTAVILPLSGRSGSWFLFNDGSGSQLPTKPNSGPFLATLGGACATNYAFSTAATGFTGWGAGVGVDLLPKVGGEKQPYNLGAYRGMAFFAKASAPLALRVSWSDANTAEEGGICDALAGSGEPQRCGDYFGKDLFVGSEWSYHEIAFEELTQRGFGLVIAEGFDSSTAYSLRAQAGGPDFEFWIDEITLLPQ